MRQRTAVTVAMVLTTFVLLLAAAVIGRLAVAPPTSSADQEALAATVETTAQGLSEQREEEYQRMLQTANARLEEANRQLQEAYQRLTAQPNVPASDPALSGGTVAPSNSSPSPDPSPPDASSQPFPSPAAPPAQITAEQAAAAARAYVGGGSIERVRLEEEHGQLVYEVRFADDSRVYIDPTSGSVLYARLERSDSKDDNSGSREDD